MPTKTVRVLSRLDLEGKTYQPNNLVEIDDKRVKSLEADGTVDSDADAVAYCKDKLGVQVVKHTPVTDESPADEVADSKPKQ